MNPPSLPPSHPRARQTYRRRLRVPSVLVRVQAHRERAGSASGHAVRRPPVDVVVPGMQGAEGHLRRSDEDDRGVRGQPQLRLRRQQDDGRPEEPTHLRQPRRVFRAVLGGVRVGVRALLRFAALCSSFWGATGTRLRSP